MANLIPFLSGSLRIHLSRFCFAPEPRLSVAHNKVKHTDKNTKGYNIKTELNKVLILKQCQIKV